jgi:hypothetical protein
VEVLRQTSRPESHGASAPFPRSTRAASLSSWGLVAASAALALGSLAPHADAAHDEGVLRTVAFGFPRLARALDAVVAAPFAILPIGTVTERGALASVGLLGVLAWILARLAMRLNASCAEAKVFGPIAACTAVASATLSLPFQREATSPGGAVLGALLAFLPLAVLALPRQPSSSVARSVLASALIALGLTYDGVSGALGAAGVLAFGALERRVRTKLDGAERDASSRPGPNHEAGPIERSLGSALATLLPSILAAGALVAMAIGAIAVAVERRIDSPAQAGGGDLLAALGLHAAGAFGTAADGPLGGHERLARLVHDHVGVVLLLFAFVGAGLALLVPRARALTGALLSLVGVGAACVAFDIGDGALGVGPPTLVMHAGVAALAAVGMQALVRAVQTTRAPFARASAAMIVLLELALPVRIADDTSFALAKRTSAPLEAFAHASVGPLPAGALVMVSHPDVATHLLALRARGLLRGDVAIVPTFGHAGPIALAELAREPRLAPFYRDLALGTAPQELSLAQLSSERPLAVLYDRRWGTWIAKHLVSSGLVSRFEPEPRGPSDRRRAVTAQAGSLEAALAVVGKDETLARATLALLAAQRTAIATAGDKQLLPELDARIASVAEVASMAVATGGRYPPR